MCSQGPLGHQRYQPQLHLVLSALLHWYPFEFATLVSSIHYKKKSEKMYGKLGVPKNSAGDMLKWQRIDLPEANAQQALVKE